MNATIATSTESIATPATPTAPVKKHRLSRYEVYKFVCFCFREDIAERIANTYGVAERTAIRLYKQETGIDIPYMTARGQRNKWVNVNGNIIHKK